MRQEAKKAAPDLATADIGPNPSLLTGWKEISSLLKVSEKTAREWAEKRGLPVRQMSGLRGRIYADQEEILAWRNSLTRKLSSRTYLKSAGPYVAALAGLMMIIIGAVAWINGTSRPMGGDGFDKPEHRVLNAVAIYDGPLRPDGYWRMRAAAFNGGHLWIAMSRDGLESRISRHRSDSALTVLESFDAPTQYITSMTFVSDTMWTVDDYKDQFIKHASDPRFIAET